MSSPKPSVLASWEAIPSRLRGDASFIGAKANGLLLLPSTWVPRFVILTEQFYQMWHRTHSANEVLQNISQSERQTVDEFLRSASSLSRQLMVRSNCPEELIDKRGAYLSRQVTASISQVAAAIDDIISDGEPEPVYVLIQHFIPGWHGHLSNERRVSPKSSIWLVEASPKLPGLPTDGRIRMSLGEIQSDLSIVSEDGMVNTLRIVAGGLTQLKTGYFHCEWVCDGAKLWIVQADPVNPPHRNLPANRYIRATEELPPKFHPESPHIKHYTNVDPDKWKKLKRPITFHRENLPTADVYLMQASVWSVSEARHSAELERDLVELCSYPLIVRCDIAEINPMPDILLETSEVITDHQSLKRFMDHTVEKFRTQGVDDSDWAFLFAYRVPLRASALVLAYPAGSRVVIDASWGYPDTMQFFPHDTYIQNSPSDQFVKTIRYKGLCLLAMHEGTRYYEVGAPDDWAPVLREDELVVLADWGKRVANSLGTGVELMALARIGGQRGAEFCLPWHYTTTPVLQYEDAIASVLSLDQINVIRSESDLTAIANSRPGGIKGYLIRPSEERLLRDKDFIRDVASTAAAQGLPLYFEGSLLGHAYYLMKSAGAYVVRVSPEESSTSRVRYGKLVRDEIPAVIERAGSIARIQALSQNDAIALLSRKLIEEAFEVSASNQSQLPEELADALEVIESLREHSGISKETLEEIQARKRESRGGFKRLIYLKETESRPLRAEVRSTGEVPLFADDSHSARTKAADQYLEFSGADSEGIITEFSVSLIPPTQKERVIFGSTMNGVKVIAKYEDANLRLTVINDADQEIREVPDNQLLLFPDSTNEEVAPNENQPVLFPERPNGR
jgi:predicted house-cleaning noncanonical NTP pyrophosphatase (MazG superfamily)